MQSVEGKSIGTGSVRRPWRVAYVVSHPIQYQAPLLKRIAADPAIDLTVFFGSALSLKGSVDDGFGVKVKWDVPLLEGYKSEFLPVLRDTGREGMLSPICHGLYQRLVHGKEGPYDLLWVHGYSTALQLYSIACGMLADIPVISRSDSRIMSRERDAKYWLKRLKLWAVSKSLDGVLTVGGLNAEYIAHYMPGVQQFPMPYAVDNAWFQNAISTAASSRAELQAMYDLDASRPVILFAAKMQERKRCGDLIQAYKLLAERSSSETLAYLVIVGDGEQRDELEQMARETGLSGIRFCGFQNQSQMPRFFDLATVFVSPASAEPWGLIVNEAMNAAIPVIVTDETGCIPDLVTDGQEGLIYQAGDVPALANALQTILDSPELTASMGQKALERVEKLSFDEDVLSLKRALTALCG